MIFKLILAIISVEAITEILLHSVLFDKPRALLIEKSDYFKELLTCGWCLSLWVAGFIILLIYLKLEIILIILSVHRISNWLHDAYGLIRKFRWRS